MMPGLLKAILLGIVQGLTEFLPVSSSGHIELTKYFLNYHPKDDLLFTVVVHFATALSTIFVFRREIGQIFSGLFSGEKESVSFSVKIILSMIPAGVVGVLLDEQLNTLFEQQIVLVSVCLIITGFLLLLANRVQPVAGRSLGFRDALIIGLAQGVALLPGISRSGATISTAMLLRIDRQQAARFSFLMVVPLILGKVAKDLMDGTMSAAEADYAALAGGFVAAFVVGILACRLMIRLVAGARLQYFAFYCFAIGLVALASYFLI